MGTMTWDKANSGNTKRNTSRKSSSKSSGKAFSGGITWKQAVDEYRQYDADAYKQLGQERIANREKKATEQRNRALGIRRYHEDDTVNGWLNRFDNVMRGYSAYDEKRAGGYTRDASGGYGAEIDSLLSEYEGIKRFRETKQYYDALTELKSSIGAIDESMAQFADEDAFNQHMDQVRDLEDKRNFDISAGEREVAEIRKQIEEAQNASFGWTDYAQRQAHDDQVKELESQLSQKRKYLNQAKEIQEADRLAEAENQGKEQKLPRKKSDAEQEYGQAYGDLGKAKALKSKIDELKGSRFGVEALDSIYDQQVQDMLEENGYESYDALKDEVERLNKSAYQLRNELKYQYLDENEDFESNSQVNRQKKTSGIGIAIGTDWHGVGDAKFDYINDIDGYRAQFAGGDKQGNSPYAIYDYMEPDEVARYNYIHNTQGEKAANEYLDYLKYELDARKTQDVQAGYAAFAEEHPVVASAASVPANLLSGVGALDATGQYVANRFREGLTGEYRPVNYNSGAMYPTVAASTIRETVSADIADKTGVISLDETEHPFLSRMLNGKSLADVYQLGMSMADSAAVALLTPVIGSGGVALLGGSAASSGMVDALKRGATDEQAITMGLLNGAFETIFEKVSLDSLLENMAKTPLQAILGQMVAEGSEEFNTTLANDAADLLVMAGKSDYMQNVDKYLEQGFDEETARKYALWEKAVGLAWDAIGGALSGGIMGGISAPISRQYQAAGTRKVYGSSQQELVNEALGIDPRNAYAQKMQKKLDNGKNLSSLQLYNLVSQNEAAMNQKDVSTIKKAASSRLTELGEEGNTYAVAAAIAKQTAGEKLTRAETKLISGSKYGQRVANELNPANVDTGGYSNRWAQGLDTQRVNAREYGMTSQLEDLSQKYGAQAQIFVRNRRDGQNVAKYDTGFQIAYEMGKANAKPEVVQRSEASRYLSAGQIDIAYKAGQLAANIEAGKLSKMPIAAEKTGSYNNGRTAQTAPATLEQAASVYGGQAQDFIGTYQKGQDVGEFAKGYSIAYIMGQQGVSADFARRSDASRYLTPAQIDAAYKAGQQASDTTMNEEDTNGTGEAVRLRRGVQRNDGTGSGGQVRGVGEAAGGLQEGRAESRPQGRGGNSQQAQRKVSAGELGIAGGTGEKSLSVYNGKETDAIRQAKAEADAAGKKLVLLTGDSIRVALPSGRVIAVRALIQGDTVYARADHKQFDALQLVRHELTHPMIDSGEIDVQQVYDRMVEIATEENVEWLVEQYAMAYGMAYDTNEAAMQVFTEIICDSQADMNAFAEDVRESAALFLPEIKKLAQQSAKTTDSRGPPSGENVKYSLEKDFSSEYDKWDKKNPRKVFSVGRTSDALKKIGVKDGEILWDASKIIKIKAKHSEMTDAIIKQVPSIIESPIIVMQSKKIGSRLTMFGEVYAEGKPILAVLELEPFGRNGIALDEIKIASAYGKDNAQQFIDSSEVKYIDSDKKRVSEWEKRTGLQLPVGHSFTNSIPSISISAENVNTENIGSTANGSSGNRFSRETVDSDGRKLTDEQQEYFKNSKVRDKDGRLLVMYHGTPNAGFTQFRTGSYFTQNREYAEGYQSTSASYLSPGKKAGTPGTYAVYLDIKKPFDTRNKVERDIFYNEYYRQWGMGTDLMESGLPDWMDGMDLQEFLEENGYDYDGLILDEGGTGGYGKEVKSRGLSYVTFNPEQVKNVDNVNPTSDPDIRFSREAIQQRDKDYMGAVQADDTRTVQRLVDEAALAWGAYRNNPEANEVFKQDGEVRTFYHGTNTGDFTVFDKAVLGSSSGDMGWFGKGFYFAFSSQEAATYGGRVIPAYLKMQNPYDYSQLYKFKGSEYRSNEYSRFAWLYNIVNQFPDIVDGQNIYAYPNDAEDGEMISWKQLAKQMDRIQKEVSFEVGQTELGNGDIAWELRADPKEESYTAPDGEVYTWKEWGMRQLFATEKEAKEPINQIGAYLANVMGVETIPRRAIERIDFSGAVQRAGYDGILQSVSGDEAVVFDSNQIKSADPVTYDDNGNVIPLSQRFNQENDDIRYSREMPTVAELQRENRLLKERLEYWKGQTQTTRKKAVRLSDVDKVAKGILGEYESKADFGQVRNAMKYLADDMLNDKMDDFGAAVGAEDSMEDALWNRAHERAVEIARNVVTNANRLPNEEMVETGKELRKRLRNTPISLENNKADFADFNDFRKRNVGNFLISDKGTPIETLWHDLQDEFGEGLFPDSIDNPADQMLHLEELMGSTKPEYANPFRGDMAQNVESCANAILDQLFSDAVRQTAPTFADRQAKKLAQMDAALEKSRSRIKQLQEEKRAAIADLQKQHREQRKQDRLNRQESADVKKYREKVEKHAKSLMDMMAHPTKEAHVPTALNQPLQELLNSIDFDSQQKLKGGEATIRDVAYTRALDAVKQAIAAQRTALDKADGDTFTLDVPPDFLEAIDNHKNMIVDATKGMDLTTNRVYEMTSDELRDLSYLLGTINKAIRDIDKLHMAGAKARVSELGRATQAEMKSRKAVKGETGNRFMWGNYTPYYAFRAMGTSAQQIFKGLTQGQAKLARTVDSTIQFAEKTYTNKEVQEWEGKKHTIQLDSGETVQMTTAQIMSFYCLSGREQAKGHMMGGGIRIGTIKNGLKDSAKSRTKDLVQKGHYTLTIEDINRINNLLTDRQKEVARKLQKYMQDVGGRLGNEISMARWDYMQFTEDGYFPIKTDDATRDVKNPDQDKSNLWAMLNKSFTKSLTKGANNAVVVGSIFDVFADHMSEMAEYNAFALPLVDAMKWFNYRERIDKSNGQIEDIGVQRSIRDTLGSAAVEYFVNLMTDINSSQKAGRHENMMGQILSRYKVSSVGWNLRVAIQQPTAILRASMILDAGSLVKGTFRIGTKELVKEMQQYSGIALWKSLGYYDLNVSRSVREQIKGDGSLFDKFNEAGMWLPGKMDEITWARIWAATKAKVQREQKLTGEALLKATAELFEDVVYQTQVADSVLTRSSFMRSKTQAMKEATSFMAEPTLSANILMSAFQDYEQGHTTWDKAKRAMMIGFYGYTLSSLVNALITSAWDAWRDDDEYEEFLEKYRQALLGEEHIWEGNLFSELNPLEKIIFVRDIVSSLKGYTSSTSYGDMIDGTIGLVESLVKYFKGEGRLTDYGVIYSVLQLISKGTGTAASNMLREVVDLWNNTFGRIYPDKKVHRYEATDKEMIRNAYEVGALTAEEAMQHLVEKGVTEDENEAYFQIKKWDNKDYSKYDAIYEAVRSGESIDAAMEELTSHGEKEKDLRSKIKSKIGDWYRGTEEEEASITKQEAIDRLRQYTDMKPDDIEDTVKAWTCKKETGISYGDIKDSYMAGDITKEQVQKMLRDYGGYTAEEANSKANLYEFVRNHPGTDGISEAAVEDYNEFCAPVGLDAVTYYNARKYLGALKNDVDENGKEVYNSAKNKGLQYIDSLPITSAQKDALYRAKGWAESKLQEAPWHQ